jgi:ferritin-like metal-binding protein YciE
MESKQLKELLLQALEHEMGGVKVYQMALKCAQNEELQEEWEKYEQETETHVQILHDVFSALQLDPEEQSPGRTIVREMGMRLIRNMEEALKNGEPAAAQLVACEAVTMAELKDHFNWELIGQAGKALGGAEGKALMAAYNEVEDQEDEHFYHSKGWARELWLEALGMKAVLPPPEEKKHVKTAIGAAKAEQARSKMR